MGRRSLAIGIGLIVAVAAAVAGTLAVTGIGDDGGSAPTGAQTIVRLEAQDETVSCGAPAPVYIYLDDLESRPSPADASVSYGVAGFSFLVHYDPAVVRIAQGVDVELNPALSQEDADGDGLARSFFPLSNIDDGAGMALLGAASLVPTGAPDSAREEGLDPVAKGEPLLLLTVRFLAVGEGTTQLRIDEGRPEPSTDPRAELEEPQVLDPTGDAYELQVKGASLAVEGGDCPEGPFATPKPTPLPTSTPGIEPEPTIKIPTPMPVTPTPAADAGRSDCNEEWNGYVDPQRYFSLCYPPNWRAITSGPQAYLGQVISLEGPEPDTGAPAWGRLTVYWEESSAFHEGVVDDRCQVVSNWDAVEEVSLSLAGQEVLACTGYELLHPVDAPPLRNTFAEIPLGPAAGYVVFFLTEAEGATHASERDTFREVLSSLRLGD